MAQLTDSGPPDRQYIQAYGDGGFRVSGQSYTGSILVAPERTVSWAVADPREITLVGLGELTGAAPPVEILLIGCGNHNQLLPRALRDGLSSLGITLESMDTGAACRTYNVLMAEDRRVGAALIAV